MKGEGNFAEKLIKKLEELERKLDELSKRLDYIESYIRERDSEFKPLKVIKEEEEKEPVKAFLEKFKEMSKKHKKEESMTIVEKVPSLEELESKDKKITIEESKEHIESKKEPEEKGEPIETRIDYESKQHFSRPEDFEVSDFESKPRDFELAIGSSIFQRLGLLFIVVSSILTTYWLYSEVIVYLSLVSKILLVYSFGLFVLIVGVRLSRSSLPKWYSEGLTSTGVAILYITTAISYYFFRIFDVITTGLLFIVILVSSLLLAKYFNFKGILIESLIGSFLVGFIVAWSFPNYPYSQIYTVSLFVLVFQRLPDELKASTRILIGSYLVIILISLYQAVLIYLGSLSPHFSLQLISLFSPVMIYWSFESREEIRRVMNLWTSWFVLMLNYFIFVAPIEFLVLAVSFQLALTTLIHKYKNFELPLTVPISDFVVSLLTWSIIGVTVGQNSITYKIINSPAVYIGSVPFAISLLKYRIERNLLKPVEERLIDYKKSIIITILLYSFGLITTYTVSLANNLGVPFIPLLIYVALRYMGVQENINFTALNTAMFFVLSLSNANSLSLTISYTVLALLYLKSTTLYNRKDYFSYNNLLFSLVTGILEIRILSDTPILAIALIYVYLIHLIYSSRKRLFPDVTFRYYNLITIYVLNLLIPVFLDTYSLLTATNLLIIYTLLKLFGLNDKVNDRLANLSLLSVILESYYLGGEVSHLMFLAFISSLGLRVLVDHVNRQKLDWIDSLLINASYVVLSYILSITFDSLMLIEYYLFAMVTIDLIIIFLSSNKLIQSMAIYSFIGSSSFFFIGLSAFGLNVFYLLYFYAFSVNLISNLLTRDIEITMANMLGFPIAVAIIYIQGFSQLLPVISLGIPYLIGWQAIKSKMWTQRGNLLLVSNIIFIVSVFASSVLVIPSYSLSIFALNLLLLVYLSKENVFGEIESMSIPVISSTLLILLEYLKLMVSPITLFVSIYLNLLLFNFTKWIKHSRKITFFFFPYQLTYGYLTIFNSVPYIDIIAIATIGFLAIIVAIQKPNFLIGINNVAALSIIGLSQGSINILSALTLIYIISYAIAYHDKYPIILLTLITPVIIFTTRNLIYPHLTAILGVTYLATVIKYNNKMRERQITLLAKLIDIIQSEIPTLTIAYSLYLLTIFMLKLDTYYFTLIYTGILFVSSFLIDLALDVKSISNYTALTSLILVGLVIYKFSLQIETTIYIAIIAISTIVFGILTDRSITRKVGLLSLLGVSIKGVADIFMYISNSNLSLFLKVAVGFLILGLILLLTSYLYLKIYKISSLRKPMENQFNTKN